MTDPQPITLYRAPRLDVVVLVPQQRPLDAPVPQPIPVNVNVPELIRVTLSPP